MDQSKQLVRAVRRFYKERKHSIAVPRLRLCPPICAKPIRRLPRGRALLTFTRTFRLCVSAYLGAADYFGHATNFNPEKQLMFLLYLYNYNPQGYRYVSYSVAEFKVESFFGVITFLDRSNFFSHQHTH